MNPRSTAFRRAGFTLIEVLAAIGLCAVLAAAAAAAIRLSSRAARLADCAGDASLLVPALYAAQRLRPDDLPAPPRGWHADHSSEIVTLPDDSLREWHWLAVSDDAGEIPPFILRILDDTP